ncbi:MAG: sigma-70 family RNA polymerase sigma factor [Chitinophagaceae bacterium]
MNSNTQQEIFIALIEQHKGIIYKIVNAYCADQEDRKDLAQTIILKLWQSFDRFDNRAAYSTWMYRIALNTAISYYRTEKKRKATSGSLAEDFLNIEELPQQHADNKTQLLHQFIAGLKDLDKALMLLYLEEKTHQEIADILGISTTNVATKIGRIKIILKQKFSQQNL